MSTETPPQPSSRTSWADFHAAEPDFADTVRARFQQHLHHVLATLRKDGSPRVSGLEVTFRDGELYLGMMHDSWKAKDLLRDPRFALHANPGSGDEASSLGDVRVSGRAALVTDPAELARFVGAVHPPEPFHLFRADLADAVRTSVEGAELVVQTWHPGTPLRTIRRA
ncbi:pyridoxamine 5'-phosphate oxidase family protein [Streptomyces sp. NPDC020412]|uniref:pyridoxamine 5'-phosphate oxidase family protein n=1 Tax=Streptomyces sp. NPDC020412 TaxID=3365073 RepID=UPI0037AAB438